MTRLIASDLNIVSRLDETGPGEERPRRHEKLPGDPAKGPSLAYGLRGLSRTDSDRQGSAVPRLGFVNRDRRSGVADPAWPGGYSSSQNESSLVHFASSLALASRSGASSLCESAPRIRKPSQSLPSFHALTQFSHRSAMTRKAFLGCCGGLTSTDEM